MRVVALLSSAAVLLAGAALAQEPSLLYRNSDYRFGVIFPNPPMTRDVTFTMRDGTTVPARQFYLEQGDDRFSVTVVGLPNAPAVDDAIVEHAAEQLRRRGEIRFQHDCSYDPGVPGRQLNMMEPNGKQLRASVYMWDHRLYITEASATPGSQPALQFEQSITLLDGNGNDLDNGQGSPCINLPR